MIFLLGVLRYSESTVQLFYNAAIYTLEREEVIKRLFNQVKKFTPIFSFCLVLGFCECEILT